MDASMLLDALRGDAVAALKRATGNAKGGDIVVAVDSANHVVLEVLAYGAGGKKLYDELRITRLLSVDTSVMDAQMLRSQVGLSGVSQWPDHTIAFIVPPSPASAQLLAVALQPFLNETIKCVVLWLPAATSECTLEMERHGLAGIVEQRNLALGLLPVDRNVATLCQDRVFADLFVHGQHHALTQVVKSILAIEGHSGMDGGRARIGQVTCHGAYASRVKQMLGAAHELQGTLPVSAPTSRFERLILVDRMEDPLSMLLTPMTYEGLLDALVGLNHGVVKFEKPVTSDDDSVSDCGPVTEKSKVLLNHLDELFEEIRDININTLITHRLAEIAQKLVSEVRTGGNNDSSVTPKTLAEVTAMLKKVPHLVKKKRSLANHLILIEQIQERSQNLSLRTCVETEMAILSGALKKGIRVPTSASVAGKDVDRALEEAILRDDPPLLDVYDVLKLLCLLSLVSGGLKEERLQWYRQQLCHRYGYHLLPLLIQLEKLELLSTKNKFDYQRRRKELALMRGVIADEDVEVSSDGDASDGSSSSLNTASDIHFMFPYTGYAPMSVRLVQTSLGIKVKPSKDIGNIFGSNSNGNGKSNQLVENASTLFASTQRRQILVYYIGGVTVAELAAYRWLNATQGEYEFFIATTAICNGTRLLRAI